MREIATAEIGEGRTRVRLTLWEVGPDLLAVLRGAGEHLGAVSLAEAPGREERCGHLSAQGHREAELTGPLARRLARAWGRRTFALAGIHLEDIRTEEIESIRENARRAAEELGPGSASPAAPSPAEERKGPRPQEGGARSRSATR